MAELVDALVSGTSGSNTLEVRVFLRPPGFRGCSSADRALRSHRRGRGFESHQLHQKLAAGAALFKSLRGYGGMVDAEDLKSFGHCDRVGSSPTIPTILRQGFVWHSQIRRMFRRFLFFGMDV